MSNETFFRMLSIAFLGALALAFLPDSQAESVAVAKLEASLEAGDSLQAMLDAQSGPPSVGDVVFEEDPMEIELKSIQEVQEINAGRFNPAVAGDLASH